jgi:uncharacterized spore protein YtfJ
MKAVQDLMGVVSAELEALAKANAVVAKPISVGDRHVVPLCSLTLGLGGGQGTGEGDDPVGGEGKGMGLGSGGGAKATPVAVVIIEGGSVRIQSLQG